MMFCDLNVPITLGIIELLLGICDFIVKKFINYIVCSLSNPWCLLEILYFMLARLFVWIKKILNGYNSQITLKFCEKVMMRPIWGS